MTYLTLVIVIINKHPRCKHIEGMRGQTVSAPSSHPYLVMQIPEDETWGVQDFAMPYYISSARIRAENLLENGEM